MKKIALITAALLLGALLLPARADHVHEPTAPVTGIEIIAGPYPGLEQNPIPCDGSVYEHNAIRIHPKVGIADRPSEHWQLRIKFRSPSPNSDGNSRQDWDANPIFHQNAGPHGVSKFEQGTGHFNHYRLNEHPGRHVIEAIVIGDESGEKYEAECVFTVPEVE